VPQGLTTPILAGSISVESQPTGSCGVETNGSIKVIATGAASYEYSFDGWATAPKVLPDNGIIGGLASGNYTVSVRANDNSCSDISQTLTLVNKDAAIVAGKVTPKASTSCGANGEVTFTVAGAMPYNYEIRNIETNAVAASGNNISTTSVTITTLPSGEYTFTLRSGTCDVPGGAFTISSEDVTVDWASGADATCEGSNGSINLTTTGITHYRLDGGKWKPASGASVEILAPAGWHTVEVKNTSGCISKPDSILINNSSSALEAVITATTATACGDANGTITMAVTRVAATSTLSYSIDGGKNYTNATLTAGKIVITGLKAGIYDIILRDTDGSGNYCYVYAYNAEVPQGMDYAIIAAPSAHTPQSFCEGAQVKDLQADGVNLVWYDVANNGNMLDADERLDNGHIYYVAQRPTPGCESTERTAVKVILDNNTFIGAPDMPYEVELCLPSTLADVPTGGNTNIRWYDQAVGGEEVNPEEIVFTADDSPYTYYAGIVIGDELEGCTSIQRAEVNISIITGSPAAPETEMDTLQYFCEGALVGNLAKPNDQILWYFNETDTAPLDAGTLLETHIYWAAQNGGVCESTRVKVEVEVTKYPEPIAPSVQGVCGSDILLLSDLIITGAHIKWYDNTHNAVPPTTQAIPGNTYYAVQTAGNCEGDEIAIEITSGDCYSPYGTIFPFVHTGDDEFNALFITTAKLYAAPPSTFLGDRFGYIRKQTPLQTVKVTYYDCMEDDPIVGAPKYPGTPGYTTNPGLPIIWSDAGVTPPGLPRDDKLTELDNCTDGTPIGKYYFDNVAAGTYILEILRQGFLVRYAEITVGQDEELYLGHREILGGDVNGDAMVNEKDLSAIRSKTSFYGTSQYNPLYDFNGDKSINNIDANIIRLILGTNGALYQEAFNWISH
jgi:hypothetical protein